MNIENNEYLTVLKASKTTPSASKYFFVSETIFVSPKANLTAALPLPSGPIISFFLVPKESATTSATAL